MASTDFILIVGNDPEHTDRLIGIDGFKFIGEHTYAGRYDNFENAVVYECFPEEGRITDETETFAKMWWERWGEIDCNVPAIFAKHLEDEVEELASRAARAPSPIFAHRAFA